MFFLIVCRGSAELVVEKATGEVERHICLSELVVKVTDRLVGFLFVVGKSRKTWMPAVHD